MSEMQVVREALPYLIDNIKHIDEWVVRGEKRLSGQTYAVAYVDLADNVIARSQNIKEFQEQILGDDFFSATGDLRWNNYLYIVAGPNSMADTAAFVTAKAIIEADKDYARKQVVSKKELELILGGARLYEPKPATKTANVLTDWERRLSIHELDLLLDCPTPRTAAIERVRQGNAKRTSSLERIKSLNSADLHLVTSKLSELTIEKFRPVHNGKTYKFGQVTLVIGPNGSGKTSLLEAVEFLYCGHNRRANSASSLSVKAMLTNLETAQEYSLTSTVEAARIKARCLAWYNRNERSAKAIIDGFTRYNFLDTDAAFRISTDLDPSEVTTDLSRLLVGPSTAEIWNYLTKINEDIDRASDKAQVSMERQKLVLEANEKTLKDIQDKPSMAKALRESYLQTLGALGWTQVPGNSKLDESEGELLLSVLGHLQALQAAGPEARTIDALRARYDELEKAIYESSLHESILAEFQSIQQTITDSIKYQKSVIENIDRWIAYSSSGFQRLRGLAPKAIREAQDASIRLGRFAVGQLPEIPFAYQTVSLEVVKHLADEALSHAKDRVQVLQALADEHGRSVAARASLATKLREAVLSSQTQAENTDMCPVCKTIHPFGELSRLINAITEGELENPELQQITEALLSAQKQLKTARSNLDTIQFVDAIAREFELSTSSSAPDICRQLLAMRTQSIALTEKANSTANELNILEENGFSPNEYDLIWSQISSILTDTEATIDAAITARHKLLQNNEDQHQKLSVIQSKIMTAKLGIREICQRVITPQWSTNVTQNDTFSTLISLRDEFSLVLTHIPQIQSQIIISGDTLLSELQTQIANASVAFNEAFSAAHSEAANSQVLVDLAKTVTDEKQVLNKMKEEAGALRKAVDVLESLFTESSLEKASQESLAAISDQINEVFSRIHAPREYEYVGQKGALLKKIITQEVRTLEQVSTGQRAAFALSIFLALNITAESAPPVLLIDDPIAHIDDLNALSFIDCLRDLAVNSGRQVFFATADTRIASLFSKKFSFLGDEFKTIQLTHAPI